MMVSLTEVNLYLMIGPCFSLLAFDLHVTIVGKINLSAFSNILKPFKGSQIIGAIQELSAVEWQKAAQ